MRLMFALLLAFAAIGPMTTPSEAAKKAPKSKMCVATALDSKKISFKCMATEKCCFDTLTSTGSCIAASAVCF